MRLVMIARVCALLLLASACTKSTPSEVPPTTAPPAAAAPPTAQMGEISGTAPAGAIVVFEPKAAREFPPGDTPAMDQVAATFSPEMLIVRTGQPVEFRNSDDTLHNVHVGNADTKEPSFNVAIPTGEVYRYTFTKDGFYHVGCDIHPAMAADILAVSTPYATIADTGGRFAIDDVAPGAYVAKIYSGGRRGTQDVEIKGGANALALAP